MPTGRESPKGKLNRKKKRMKNYKKFIKEANDSADKAIKDSLIEPIPILEEVGEWLTKDVTLKRAWIVGLVIIVLITGVM